MDTNDIRRYVPHAGAMCLLDRVCGHGETWLEAEVTIRSDSLFCDGQGVGAWVGIEYLAQGIAAFAGMRARAQGKPVTIGFLVSTRKYVSNLPVFPVGSQLTIRVDSEYEADNGLCQFNCRMRRGEEEVASAIITVFQPANPAEFLGSGQA